MMAAAAIASAAVLGLGTGMPAFASTSSQQIGLDDDSGQVNSMFLSGTNQNNQTSTHCFATPQPFTHAYNYWWLAGTSVSMTLYTTSNCSGAPKYSGLYATIPSSPTTSWRCLWDGSGFPDWTC